VSGFDKANPLQIQPVSVLRDNQSAGDVIPGDFLNDLRHSSGCLSSTHNDQPPVEWQKSFGYREDSIRYLNRIVKTRGRIRGM
jgi:hypothetical protein